MISLALIGNGKWGNKYVTELKKFSNVKLVEIRTHDYQDLIDREDIDGIIIATPDSTHAEIIKHFPDKFLLVEKPFVTSLKDANEISNKKIMVGYIYLYNLALQEQMKDLGQIHKIDFTIHNTEKVEGTNPLWYLGSHAISFCLLHLGRITDYQIKCNQDNYTIKLKHIVGESNISVGWGYATKKRSILIKADKNVDYNPEDTQKISPLHNEVTAFLNFIEKGTSVPSNLKHAKEVTNALVQIEQMMS